MRDEKAMKNGKSPLMSDWRQTWKRDRVAYGFLIPYAVFFLVFTVLPVVISIIYGFTYYNIFQPTKWIWFDNYVRLMTRDSVFPIALQNTLKFAIICGPGGYILSYLVAWMINEVSSKIRMIFVLICYSPTIAGSIYVVFSVLFSGDAYGYINSALTEFGIIEKPIEWLTDPNYISTVIIICVLWGSMGAGFLSFVAGFRTIDTQFYEAAAIDGLKNRWQELWYVTLPMMKPQLLFGATMSITSAFSIHQQTIALAGYPSTEDAVTTIVNLMVDYGYQRFDLGYASAMATVLFLMMLVSRWLINKLIARTGT